MEETWKKIKGWSDYEVSNFGRIKSLKNKKESILIPQNHDRGYKQVYLYIKGSRQKHFIHRLVAMMFIEEFDKFPVVNHKDECKSNNNLSNLEVVTFSENTQYYYKNKNNEF